MTITQISYLVENASRLSAYQEKRDITNQVLALASLFDEGKSMKAYFSKLDGLLLGENGETKAHEKPKQKSREEQYRHSVKELMKLNQLMKRG